MAGKKAKTHPTSSTGTGGPTSSEAASVKDPMEAALDNSISSMKANMAQNILKKEDNEKKGKKDKRSKNKKEKKRKSTSSSSSEDSSEEPELSPEEVQLQLGLRPKDTKLGGKFLRYEDMSPEQLAYILAGVKPELPGVMDLFELGGELCSLRRKEAEVLKKGDKKEAAVRVVANSESRWKGRLLGLFEMITDKGRKTTFVQFDTLEQLRQSIFSRIKQIVKKDPDLVEKVAGYIHNVKKQAKSDLDKWDQQVSVFANKTKGRKKDKKKRQKKAKKDKKGKKSRKVSSSSSSSSSSSDTSPSPSEKEESSGSEPEDDDDEEKSKKSLPKKRKSEEASESMVQSTLDKYKRKKTKERRQKKRKNSECDSKDGKEPREELAKPRDDEPGDHDDDDLFQHPRFSPKGPDGSLMAEELQELLHPPLERFMKLDTDRHHFFEMLACAHVVTPNDMVMGLAAFKEGSAGTEGNLIKHFTDGFPRADAAFKQMTFGGKVAVSKILRALLKNQESLEEVANASARDTTNRFQARLNEAGRQDTQEPKPIEEEPKPRDEEEKPRDEEEKPGEEEEKPGEEEEKRGDDLGLDREPGLSVQVIGSGGSEAAG